MQQHGSIYFACRPDPGGWSQNSENEHVAYQVTGNHKCINMVANILPADPPPHDNGGG